MTIKVELGLGCCDTFGDGERERELVLYSCHHPVMFHGNDYKPLSACHKYKDRSCILSFSVMLEYLTGSQCFCYYSSYYCLLH